MRPTPFVPGVPAMGHIAGGWWHPGPISTCTKGSCGRDRAKEPRR